MTTRARADVVAERHGAKQAGPIDAELLAGRKRRRDDRATRMGVRIIVRIIGLIGMSQDTIGECGIDRRGSKGKTRDRGRALRAVFADVPLGRLAGRQFRSGDHRCQSIEQMVFGVFGDFRRQGARTGGAHIGAERAHDRSWLRCLGEDAQGPT
jgi:hypothetical protein